MAVSAVVGLGRHLVLCHFPTRPFKLQVSTSTLRRDVRSPCCGVEYVYPPGYVIFRLFLVNPYDAITLDMLSSGCVTITFSIAQCFISISSLIFNSFVDFSVEY